MWICSEDLEPRLEETAVNTKPGVTIHSQPREKKSQHIRQLERKGQGWPWKDSGRGAQGSGSLTREAGYRDEVRDGARGGGGVLVWDTAAV